MNCEELVIKEYTEAKEELKSLEESNKALKDMLNQANEKLKEVSADYLALSKKAEALAKHYEIHSTKSDYQYIQVNGGLIFDSDPEFKELKDALPKDMEVHEDER